MALEAQAIPPTTMSDTMAATMTAPFLAYDATLQASNDKDDTDFPLTNNVPGPVALPHLRVMNPSTLTLPSILTPKTPIMTPMTPTTSHL